MARLFISHSSLNNAKAIEVRDWLAAKGWDDVFLDLDPERGIAAGQRWKEALQKAAYRCEVVLALVSKEWLASGWCRSEVDAARLMGKKVIVALVGADKSHVPPDLTDEQFIDLSGDPQAYRRLKEGLKRAGLDPTSFPFEPGRRPYPGFAYLDEQDAAVFFGRDAQIVRGLDEIRRLARTGVARLLVILGASGSGKSSFLRAGLWPRLRRDDLAWLPLPILRPERAAISGKYGLAQALQQVTSEPRFANGIRQRGLPRSRAEIQDFVEKTDDGLAKFFAALREIAQSASSGENALPPTILLAVDQGEELFNEEGREEARRFIEILTKTLTTDPRTLAILVVRSDSFPLVQGDPSLAALPKDTFTLDMMLEGSYRAVIEGPAQLIEPPLRIDPLLTEALLEDISGQDALPLLAFTLAHLYENYAADNELTLAGYERIGRVKGVIDKTVAATFDEAAARGEAPKDEKAQLALARSAFIPHLAQVNAAGQFVRHVTARDQIPAEARALIDRFADQRLLIKDRRKDADGKDVDVVEVAHEALLRQPPFSDWLADDREFLVWRDRLSQAHSAFKAEQRGLLAGRELAIARNYLQTRAERDIEPADQAFIRDSIEADDVRRAEEAEQARKRQAAEKEEQERRIRDAEQIAVEQKKAAVAGRQTAGVAVAGLVIAVLVAAAAFWQYIAADQAKKEAVAQRDHALVAEEGAKKAKLEAERLGAIAEQRKQEAEQETRKTAQRSAVLAAGAATALANEGSTDSALLLLLDGARWFDNANVPDDIRIAFTNALQKTERASIARTSPGIRTFELRSALVLVDDTTNDVSIIRKSAEPTLVRKGSASDSPVRLIADSPGSASFFILRKNGTIEKGDLDTLNVADFGRFEPPKMLRGPFTIENFAAFPAAGVLVHAFHSDQTKENGAQIYDVLTNKLVEGKLDPSANVKYYFARSEEIWRGANNRLYLIERNTDKTVVSEINSADETFILSPIPPQQPDFQILAVGDCIASMPPDQLKLASKELTDYLNGFNHYSCQKSNKSYLLTLTQTGSGGDFTTIKFVLPKTRSGDAQVTDLKDEVGSNVGMSLANNPTWVGLDPQSGMVAGIVNRDVFAYDRNEFSFRFRLPTPPSTARFINPRTLVVVEDGSGQLTTFDLRDRPSKPRSLSSLAPHGFLGTEKSVSTFNHGNCVGYAIPQVQSESFPDRRTIQYRNPSQTNSADTHELAISGEGRKSTINLGSTGGCVAISLDWKRLLVMNDASNPTDVDGLTIYDFEKALAAGSLDGAAVATIPVKSPSSAFFVGSTGDLITTDFTNRVLRWSFNEGRWRSWEVYHGDNEVAYAEPDESGDRLIIIEHHVGANNTGLLYSVKARQTWYDLGSDYKWFGATFLSATDVATSAHWKWKDSFPVLNLKELQDLAKDNLSPHCRPADAGDFHTSKCWPAYLE